MLPQRTHSDAILPASFAFLQLASDKSNAYKQRDQPHSGQCWTPPFRHKPQQCYTDNSAVLPHPVGAGLPPYVHFGPGLLFCLTEPAHCCTDGYIQHGYPPPPKTPPFRGRFIQKLPRIQMRSSHKERRLIPEKATVNPLSSTVSLFSPPVKEWICC